MTGILFHNYFLKFQFFEKSSKTLKRALILPSLELNIEENSYFCVLAKLKPSIIKSLINGLSEFLV